MCLRGAQANAVMAYGESQDPDINLSMRHPYYLNYITLATSKYRDEMASSWSR